MNKKELEKMIKELSEDEREKFYEDAFSVVSLLKLIGIDSAVCQVNSHIEDDGNSLVYAVVIPESQFDQVKSIVKKNLD